MNQPLPPVEQAKVFFFWVGLILLVGAGGAGILLIIVTLWGLYRMRSTHDFSYLETVRIIHKGFAAIATVGLALLSIFVVNNDLMYDHNVHVGDMIAIVLSLMIYPVYYFLLNTLFYAPLSNHKEWVVANGIFATTEAKKKKPRSTPLISLPNFSIKASSNLSVADELIKLNNLKEANLITVDEFNALRSKLLS